MIASKSMYHTKNHCCLEMQHECGGFGEQSIQNINMGYLQFS